MTYENLLLALDGRIAMLTVNRPDKRNALDEVRAAKATVLIITGAGDKAFVSGADINAIRARRCDDALASINSRLMAAIESHEAVSIAAVNGYALGARIPDPQGSEKHGSGSPDEGRVKAGSLTDYWKRAEKTVRPPGEGRSTGRPRGSVSSSR